MLYIRFTIPLLFFVVCACSTNTGIRPKDYMPIVYDSDVKNFTTSINLLASGNLVEAKEKLLDVAEDNPELAGPWVNLAMIDFSNGHVELAKNKLMHALELNPNNPYALNLLGVIAVKSHNLLEAHKYYSSALSYKSDYALAHYNIALLYDIYFQNISLAIKHYTAYMNLIDYQDPETKDWLQQLSNSVSRS